MLSPAGRTEDAPPLAGAGVHLSIALSAFNALLTPAEGAKDIDRLADAEHALDHLHRTTNYVREHLVASVSEANREARHQGLVDSCRDRRAWRWSPHSPRSWCSALGGGSRSA
ncbi:hypothetical protein [Streptomyces salinarius]|uniref:Uncharacterized protein n=1 Tax=Streptomyces salinarius TaxID=2762598 RepID=A0ABW8BNT2_9ACTN